MGKRRVKHQARELCLTRDFFQVDVYAFAITLWEITAHQPPWRDLHGHEVFNQVVQGNRPTVPSECAEIAGWRELMESCWAETPADRPTFLKVKQDLAEVKSAMEMLSQNDAQEVHVRSASYTFGELSKPMETFQVNSERHPEEHVRRRTDAGIVVV